MERMDQLSELKLKLTAAQYLEDLREEVIVENLYRTEEETERQQELKTEKSRRIIQKIQAEILKKNLPINRSSQMAVKWMKSIKENHLNMASVQMELLKKLRQHDAYNFFEESNGKLEAKNQFDALVKNSYERDEAKELLKLVTADKNAELINKIQVDLLRTILPMDRSARMAVKYMKIIRESRTKLLTIQDEVLKKLKEREDDYMAESLKKLEKVNQAKWKTTLDAWDKEKRYQIVFFILVDQVRRLRSRRCPQMLGKIMKKIQARQLILQKLHGELKRVNERETVHQTRETAHKELMTEIKRREEMKERQKRLQMEIMRAVDDSHFIPRKLFLNGVETFKSVPKPNVTARVGNREKKEATISQCNGAKSESKLKSGTKPTLKNRLKRLFGFH